MKWLRRHGYVFPFYWKHAWFEFRREESKVREGSRIFEHKTCTKYLGPLLRVAKSERKKCQVVRVTA